MVFFSPWMLNSSMGNLEHAGFLFKTTLGKKSRLDFLIPFSRDGREIYMYMCVPNFTNVYFVQDYRELLWML